MLRITAEEDAQGARIKLEGKISGPWVDELRRSWESLASPVSKKQLRVDLRGVLFVDAKGTELLREIYRRTGATFLADSPLTRHFAELATRQSSSHKSEGA